MCLGFLAATEKRERRGPAREQTEAACAFWGTLQDLQRVEHVSPKPYDWGNLHAPESVTGTSFGRRVFADVTSYEEVTGSHGGPGSSEGSPGKKRAVWSQ